MIIKKASVVDIPLIQELAHTIWPVAYENILSQAQLEYMLDSMYSLNALQSQIVNLQQVFLLAMEEEKSPIAFASYGKISELSDDRKFKLHKLYVLPQYQGKGVGQLLIQYINNTIRSAQQTILSLNVNRHNTAVEFYKRLGFRVVKEEDIDIGNGYFMNDYVMEKLI